MNWTFLKTLPKWLWIVGSILLFVVAVNLLFPEDMERIRRENAAREASIQQEIEQKRANKEAKRAEKKRQKAQVEVVRRDSVDMSGEYGWLGTPSGVSDIFVAESKSALDEYMKIAIARDQLGLSQMMDADRLFTVTAGTRVLVINTSMFATEVRIQEGPSTGRTAWVPHEFVRTSKP